MKYPETPEEYTWEIYSLFFSVSSPCGSRGSSADEFSCRDWSLGEAFAWYLIWAPHSSFLADLWGRIGRLYPENTPGFRLSRALVDSRGNRPTIASRSATRSEESLLTWLIRDGNIINSNNIFSHRTPYHLPYAEEKVMRGACLMLRLSRRRMIYLYFLGKL